MEPRLLTDDDTNLFFDEVVSILIHDIGLYADEANSLVHEYYNKFTDDNFCEEINIPKQDDDFFFHEGEKGIALRVYYYLKLKGDPSPEKFIEWRANRYKRKLYS